MISPSKSIMKIEILVYTYVSSLCLGHYQEWEGCRWGLSRGWEHGHASWSAFLASSATDQILGDTLGETKYTPHIILSLFSSVVPFFPLHNWHYSRISPRRICLHNSLLSDGLFCCSTQFYQRFPFTATPRCETIIVTCVALNPWKWFCERKSVVGDVPPMECLITHGAYSSETYRLCTHEIHFKH